LQGSPVEEWLLAFAPQPAVVVVVEIVAVPVARVDLFIRKFQHLHQHIAWQKQQTD
jgi:hypothetical protein